MKLLLDANCEYFLKARFTFIIRWKIVDTYKDQSTNKQTIRRILHRSWIYQLSTLFQPADMCLLSNNIYDYYNVSQGKITVPGIDDSEELQLADVSLRKVSLFSVKPCSSNVFRSAIFDCKTFWTKLIKFSKFFHVNFCVSATSSIIRFVAFRVTNNQKKILQNC